MQGTSGTVLSTPLGSDFAIPSASKNFGAGLDGAYFLTTQYGAGLKYRFYTANCKQSSLSGYEDIENEYDYPVWKRSTTSCKEPSVEILRESDRISAATRSGVGTADFCAFAEAIAEIDRFD